MCDDDCPDRGARHKSPYDADDLTLVVERDGSAFIVLRSPESTGYFPSYREIGRFGTRKKAKAFLVRHL
jgi:hypothetical protein